MNDLLDKILLAGNKFMPETPLRWPGFTYSACGLFLKRKNTKNLKKQDTQDILLKWIR